MLGAIQEGIHPVGYQLGQILRDGHLAHPFAYPKVEEAAVETPQYFDIE